MLSAFSHALTDTLVDTHTCPYHSPSYSQPQLKHIHSNTRWPRCTPMACGWHWLRAAAAGPSGQCQITSYHPRSILFSAVSLPANPPDLSQAATLFYGLPHTEQSALTNPRPYLGRILTLPPSFEIVLGAIQSSECGYLPALADRNLVYFGWPIFADPSIFAKSTHIQMSIET